MNKFTKDLQKTQNRLNELYKNKEREQQIIGLGEDVKDTFTFYSTVLISLALNMSVGIGLYIYAKKKSKRKLLEEEIVKL